MPGWSNYSVTSENIGIYEEIFENVRITDCHSHIGIDRDGNRISAAKMIEQMDKKSVDRSIIFALNDPRNNKDFHEGNEEILQAKKKYPDRFIPFLRLNPHEHWKTEFELRKSQGFLGVKLHPLSQNFKLTYSKVMKIYAECEKRDMAVLVHAGFGLEEMADDLVLILKKFPKIKFILGHSGFPDIDNVIRKVSKFDNVLFDTSTCKIFDLYELLKNVDYRKISYGSDVPYCAMDLALESVVDTAIIVGKTANQIKSILGGNISRWFP